MRACWSLLVLMSLAPAAAAQIPTLSHTAPKLGSELTIQLEGAPASAPVRLYFSPGEASTLTPFGTLELARKGLTLVAAGMAGPQGSFGFTQPVPLDPALAETWGHYQALVQDATAPGGWVLSQAVHLRYLGTRLYETCVGILNTPVRRAELRVLSLVHKNTIGSIPLGPGAPTYVKARLRQGQPVFNSNLSLGAVVPTEDRLVVFDNFDLTPLAVLSLQEASRELIAGLDGESVVVLEAGARRILWVDLATATVSDSLSLPWPARTLWTSPDGGRQAWVGEHPTGQQRDGLRHVDLEARVVLEGILLGSTAGSSSALTNIGSAPGRVFATSTSFVAPTPLLSVSAVDFLASPPSVQTIRFSDQHTTAFQPLEGLGMLAMATAWTVGPGDENLRIASLTGPLAMRTVPPPFHYQMGADIEYRAFEEDDNQLWVLHPCCDWDGGPGSLLRLSYGTWQWEEFGSYTFGGPHAMELAHDGLVHVVGAALDGIHCSGCPEPKISLLDVPTLTFSELPGGWRPIALYALEVP